MIFGALAALAAGAAAGIFLALQHFLRKRLPVWAALLHGLGGATGFTLVLLLVVHEPAFVLARQALYLLIVTVALGCINLLFHVRKVRHRSSLIVMHALCAVSGVGTLLYAAFSPPAVATAATARLSPAQPAAVAPANPPPAPAPLEPPAAAPAAPTAPSAPTKDASKPAEPEPSLAQTINFDSASATISPDSQAAIEETATTLNTHPDIALVEVQGHADERGDDARNVELTRARAQAVLEALVRKGVARQRLHAAGYGARCPSDPECQTSAAPASCHDPSRQQNDRRVVFVTLLHGKTAFKGELVCAQGAALIPPADRVFQKASR